jgi:hypothetical protein
VRNRDGRLLAADLPPPPRCEEKLRQVVALSHGTHPPTAQHWSDKIGWLVTLERTYLGCNYYWCVQNGESQTQTLGLFSRVVPFGARRHHIKIALTQVLAEAEQTNAALLHTNLHLRASLRVAGFPGAPIVPSNPNETGMSWTASWRAGVFAIKRVGLPALALVGVIANVALAAADPPRIRIAPTIVATAGSQIGLAIELSPPGAVPSKSYLNLRGLPPTMALADAHVIAPGSWAVPLASLPMLNATIPAGLSGQFNISVSLIGLDGRMLAQAATTLTIQHPAASAALEKLVGSPPVSSNAKVPVPTNPTPPNAVAPQPERRQHPLSPQERQAALSLLKRGDDLLATGNVSSARLFYERAADAGLAEAALALAMTFDPNELARRNVVGGVQADSAAARRWYERARDLGASDAESRLAQLGPREQ